MTDFARDTSARNVLQRLGITDYLNRSGVTEVMINRPKEVFLEGDFGVQRIEDERLTLSHLSQLANVLSILNNKHLTIKEPMHSVTLPDGERGHMIMPPACEDDTLVFAFRKPSTHRFSLEDYLVTQRLPATTLPVKVDSSQLAPYEKEMLAHKETHNWLEFFQLAVQHRLNICMVGGTGSGKTTFTKAIADLIPASTRIITIEDTHELDLPHHANRVHLFYKEHITAKAVIASCLRLKPDRIFLTELRGDEAWDYLSALNTGHPGGLTSVHANDAESA
ncbi:P-type DNA transfer ATPase VirB11, partial [Paenalcaligenes sp.]